MIIYSKKKNNLIYANKQNKIYLYLLKGLAITRANQVWSTDIFDIKV